MYFILLPGDTNEDLYLETNLLGEESFGTFYAGTGYKVLTKIIDTKPELLETVTILADTGKKFTVEEFLTILSNFKTIKTN